MAPFSSPVINIMEVFIFNQFPFDPALRRNLSKLGYTVPTPVQAAAIPLALAGKDLIVIAETGCCKTAAFLLPVLEKLISGSHGRTGKVERLGGSETGRRTELA